MSVNPRLLFPSKDSAIMQFLGNACQEAGSHITETLNNFKRDCQDAFDFFSLPVNNYLKNSDDIDKDFISPRKLEKRIVLKVIPAEEALASILTLEENY
jgi:hypothetical protein